MSHLFKDLYLKSKLYLTFYLLTLKIIANFTFIFSKIIMNNKNINLLVRFFNVIFYFLSFHNFSLNAQPGNPFIQNYYPKDYHSQAYNTAVIHDNRGLLYFGNTNGILEYDGQKWRIITVANNAAVQSLCIDSSGTIYVGCQSDIGFLRADSTGYMRYKSLINFMNKEDLVFSVVWQTMLFNKNIYFNTFNKLFKWDGKKFKTWNSQTRFFLASIINNNFYIPQKDIGLMQLYDDSLSLFASSSMLPNQRIYLMLPLNNKRILVGTRNDGFWTIEFQEAPFASNLIESKFHFSSFRSEADDYIFNNNLYYGKKLSDGNFAFATLNGGAVVIDTSGNFIGSVNTQSGLQSQSVNYIHTDQNDNLWLALDKGLSKVDIANPIKVYNNIVQFSGIINDIAMQNDLLYISTTQGMYSFSTSSPHNFQTNNTNVVINNQCMDLIEIDDFILAGSVAGLYFINKNKTELVWNENPVNCIYLSLKDSTQLYIGTKNGLSIIRYNKSDTHKNPFIFEGMIQNSGQHVVKITEDDKGNIWYSTSYEGLKKISSENISRKVFKYSENFDTTDGLPDMVSNLPFRISNKLLFGTSAGIYKFQESKNRFIPDSSIIPQLADTTIQVFNMVEDKKGNIWMYIINGDTAEVGIAIKEINGSYKWHTTPFKRLPKGFIYSIYPQDNGITWLGGDEGLFTYNSNVKYNYELDYPALIRKVSIGNDSVIFGGTYWEDISATNINLTTRVASLIQPKELIYSIPYELNKITFEFAAPSYDNEKENKFQYFLKDFEKDWSNWTKEAKANYTNLNEGTYYFHVRAKNIYDYMSKEAVFEFTILPPWYRSVWAYSGYVLLLVSMVYGIVQLSIRRLKAAKVHLEGIVRDRTKEIVEKSKQLEVAFKHIEEKNKDITDSIRYAKRIQTAIMPDKKEIYQVLSKSFILYKAKDIVSGDFYFFASTTANAELKKDNSIIIATVDCTGHGVPGAFMSMIGNDQLNKIIIEKSIITPSIILDELNNEVRFALHQLKEETEVRDGMDLALCKINLTEKKIEYAGAHRPLYIFRKKNSGLSAEEMLEEIKADKMAIGGVQLKGRKQYSNNIIQLEEHDTIYIFTDGFIDQFGGDKNKKYSTRRFREFLISIQEKSMNEQEQAIEEEFAKWKGNEEQVDDVLIIGIRF